MLTDRDYRTLARFRYALRVFQHFSEEAARSEGLTPHQHQLLLAIRGYAGEAGPTIGEMAEQLQLQHHSAVELVGRAVEAGLVSRRVDPDDRRRQRLALTRTGDRTLSKLSVAHRAELRKFRDQMSDVLQQLG